MVLFDCHKDPGKVGCQVACKISVSWTFLGAYVNVMVSFEGYISLLVDQFIKHQLLSLLGWLVFTYHAHANVLLITHI